MDVGHLLTMNIIDYLFLSILVQDCEGVVSCEAEAAQVHTAGPPEEARPLHGERADELNGRVDRDGQIL